MLDVGVEPTATRLKVARSTTELTERILYVIHPDGAHPTAIFLLFSDRLPMVWPEWGSNPRSAMLEDLKSSPLDHSGIWPLYLPTIAPTQARTGVVGS